MSTEPLDGARSDALRSMGEPASIAIVGASHEGGGYYGAKLMGNVVGAKTSARIYPVNPRYSGETMLGHKVYSSLRDLPEIPDIAIFATRASVVTPALREAAELGVKTSVIITSAEEAEAKQFDAEVGDVARSSGMRIIGPNSMGIMNGAAALNGSFASGLGGGIPNGPVAFLSQSGAIISCMLQRDQGSNIGYSWLISTGNEAATSIEQLFNDIVDDDNVGVIILFVEGVSDGAMFRRAALRAQIAGKPVVLLKAGVSEFGRNAVQSHTGRMAGTRDVFKAVADESAIIQVDNFAQMFAAARALRDHAPRRRGKAHGRQAIVMSNSGGLTTVTADHLSDLGWELPGYSQEIREAMEREARKTGLLNPADVPGSWVDNPRMARVMLEAGKQPGVDTIFIVSGAGGNQAKNVASEVLKAIPDVGPDVYVAWLGATAEMRKEYEDAGRTLYDDPWAAISAAETVAKFRNGQLRLDASRELLSGLSSTPTGAKKAAGSERIWTASETLAAAEKHGVPTVPSEVVTGLDAAKVTAVAERMGYPIVLKIETDAISHKSDVGGVRVGINDASAIERAVTDFARIAEDHGVTNAGVLVQKMVSGIEVLVGIKDDPAFGPVLFVGAGGIFAELQSDLVGIPLPTTRAEIERKLAEHKILNALLDGYRGAPPGDRKAIFDAIEGIAGWAVACDGLLEADFNPVMVSRSAAYAVDARATVRE